LSFQRKREAENVASRELEADSWKLTTVLPSCDVSFLDAMTARQAAAYSGGGLLLLAWLASAAGFVRQRTAVEEPPKPVETSGTTTLAADVQAQTLRLKSRLASAPTPQKPVRNPFTFAPREAAPRRDRRAASELPLPAVAELPEPAIDLVGVAESQTPKGLIRTAIISTLAGELFLVKEGELVAARYRVKAVAADAVELSDLMSGGVRRLALRE
jgi:hypothetical protein